MSEGSKPYSELTKKEKSELRRQIAMDVKGDMDFETAAAKYEITVELARQAAYSCGFRRGEQRSAKRRFVYIELFHGRTSLDEKLDDWGREGPILGPFPFVHTTYGHDLKCGDETDAGFLGLSVVEDCIYYNGIFYGDWTVAAVPPVRDDRLVELLDPAKAKPPTIVTSTQRFYDFAKYVAETFGAEVDQVDREGRDLEHGKLLELVDRARELVKS